MKDNKIDIMCKKIGDIIMVLNKHWNDANTLKALRQLQYDLEILRKCTLDNPDYKWSDEQSKKPDYYQMKRSAMRNED